MDPIITNALMTFGAGFTGATFSKAKGPGQALDDVMTLVGFDRLHEVAEKKRAKRELNMQLYKDSIAQKIVAIPEENLKDPPLSIVGPALEASKYYIEEENLREMFAKLIASSMDERHNDIAHPSFVEIIKQLSPNDAIFLKKFNSVVPVADIIITGTVHQETGKLKLLYEGPTYMVFKNFYADKEFPNWIDNARIISNLLRLGLIEIENTELYDKSIYLDLDNKIKEFQNQTDSKEILKDANNGLDPTYMPYNYNSHPGYISLTDHGKSFFFTCI